MKYVLLLVLLLLSAPFAHACDCEPRSIQEELDQADVVFIGTATEVKTGLKQLLKKERVREAPVTAKFDVSQTVKGDPRDTRVINTNENLFTCSGYNFDQGESYVVFATTTEENLLDVTFCTRTTPVSQAAEILPLVQSYTEPVKESDPQTEHYAVSKETPWSTYIFVGLLVIIIANILIQFVFRK